MQPSQKLSVSSLLAQPVAWGLIAVMAATRFHHFGSAISLPDASLAVFFLAGFRFKSTAIFAVLLAEAALIDYLAISQFSVSDYCISPAYVFLLPTYYVVWRGGQLSAALKVEGWHKLAYSALYLFAGVTVAFLISNGSFYLFSGKFSDTNWLEYSQRLLQYYPPYLLYAALYVAIAYGLAQMYQQLKQLGHSRQAS